MVWLPPSIRYPGNDRRHQLRGTAPPDDAAVGTGSVRIAGCAAALSAGLDDGLVPVPPWVVAALGAFIVAAILVFLTVQWVVRRRGPR